MASWQDKAAAKRASLATLIPSDLKLSALPGSATLNVTLFPFDSVLSHRDVEITETVNVSILLKKISEGEWTATEVVSAYYKRAIVAHQLVNCLTEIFIDQALARAKELDDYFQATGKTIGPLHLKDQIDVKGVELTMGYVGWIGNVSKENSVCAQLLLDQGAVLYVRTNVPQALMFGESVNNVFGTTSNPFNRNLTCGGSSGGEGALIAMKGSPLGVGSDLGGSIRIPSAFQGLYGLRPSYNRIPYCGSTNSMEGQEAITSVLGPMTCSVDGLKVFMQAMADAKPWLSDPVALRLPWNDAAYLLADHGGDGARLCFALMWDDGVCRPMPPYIRALRETKAALEAAGHKGTRFSPSLVKPVSHVHIGLFNADGGHDIALARGLSGEPKLGWSTVLDSEPKHLSTYEYWQLCRERTIFIKKHLDHWNDTVSTTGTGRPVDAIIAPASPSAPSQHNTPGYIYYTGFCNLCDYSAAVFPVTTVDPAIDVKLPAHEFRSVNDQTNYENCMNEPETFRNAPISLQCIGRKNEEEAVIRMTEIVSAALQA
ncbi:Amidase domain-containing protein [Mycena indigotica]|uniref:amidase n=1 Tax=Mycena indigotica TaxID=2126181 RepID=A0A8H6W9B1_9AGAR|nr:Amidase domain-containing protein [Mycena indigotica]KAF7309527.1 Amidase domain-containing protein [Mycena indigotica]